MGDPERFDQWDEFQWELTLREDDEAASRYFQLLRRFCDLPGGEQLIADRMGADFEGPSAECDIECDTCPHRWEGEATPAREWLRFPGAGNDDEEDADDEENAPQPGDDLFFEKTPSFNMLRQTALGWCNIYAAVLPPEARETGLQALYDIGRALANLGNSIDDGTFERPAASVAFAKRSLAHINKALGGLHRLSAEKPQLKKLLYAMRGHLLKSRERILQHLEECRQRMDAGPS